MAEGTGRMGGRVLCGAGAVVVTLAACSSTSTTLVRDTDGGGSGGSGGAAAGSGGGGGTLDATSSGGAAGMGTAGSRTDSSSPEGSAGMGGLGGRAGSAGAAGMDASADASGAGGVGGASGVGGVAGATGGTGGSSGADAAGGAGGSAGAGAAGGTAGSAGAAGAAGTGGTAGTGGAAGSAGVGGTAGVGGGAGADGGSYLRVFVTSTVYTGDLVLSGGGASGPQSADNLCTVRASVPGLGGTWRAWISAGANAYDRITANGPWRLVDGSAIAFANRTALTRDPDVPINMTELGTVITPGASVILRVWTGTLVGGTAASGLHCNGWSAGGILFRGLYGNLNTDDGRWTHVDSDTCINTYRLYCFEV